MKQYSVRDVMTADVVTVQLETSYGEIAAILAEHRINAVPVLDGLHRLVGVVTEADLLRRVEFADDEQKPHLVQRPSVRNARHKAKGAVAGDLMTAPAITTGPDESAAAAARLLAGEGVRQLPVVDRQGRLVGIVTRRDLLSMFRRPDTDIRSEVAEAVLRRTLGIDPLAVEVDVHDGVVTLTGVVRRASTAQLAVRLVEALPGVAAVVDRIAAEPEHGDRESEYDAAAGPVRKSAAHPVGGCRIVAGVDGSDGGRRALRWAVQEAADRGCTVQAVAAWYWEGVGSPLLTASEQQRAAAMLQHEIGELPADLRASVPIAIDVVEGPAAQVLTTAAREADLLVLGAHGHSRALHRVLGSVSEECVSMAGCPVVVVPVAAGRAETAAGVKRTD